jgi:hypothetical protein
MKQMRSENERERERTEEEEISRLSEDRAEERGRSKCLFVPFLFGRHVVVNRSAKERPVRLKMAASVLATRANNKVAK